MKKKIGFSFKALMSFLGRQARNPRVLTLLVLLVCGVCVALADGVTGNEAGVGALGQVATDIKKYVEPAQKIIYAIAAVVAIGGAISVYVKMNNEEQDVKKSIMMVVGACIFLIAAATALPKFFGSSEGGE